MDLISDKIFKDIKIISYNSFKDKRGNFTRLFCKKELKNFNLNQINLSKNIKKYTLRGIHYQYGKYAEDKIINCLNGKFYFVAVDLKKNSKNYLKYFSITLTEKDNKALLIPKSYGTAFLTLMDNTNVLYFMSNPFNHKYSNGIKYNDKSINILWPNKPKIISKKDNNLNFL